MKKLIKKIQNKQKYVYQQDSLYFFKTKNLQK